jgi:hypothetical protein
MGSGARAGKPYGERPWHVVRGVFEFKLDNGRDLLIYWTTVETFLLGRTPVHAAV